MRCGRGAATGANFAQNEPLNPGLNLTIGKSRRWPSLSKYFLIANQEGTEKINGHPDFDYNEDSVKVLKSPKGTTFVIPNTGGTKAYDAIYGYSLEHIKAVRPKLSWLTQAQLEHDDYLFEKGWQPHRSERFKTKHENWRDSSKQKFVVYRITGDRPTGEVYQVFPSRRPPAFCRWAKTA